MTEAPRVFMSHASEDKERFVIGFARRLRERGIDVWLDRWEMYPGDSLVDKIFIEGIGQASAVIVVLSQYSVNKPWVKEELNAAVVKRISTGSKLIPVVLDSCEVPEVLKSTIWERVENLGNYDASVDRIVATIFGYRDKPELGSRPVHTTLDIKGIPGFSKTDSLVLQEFARRALDTGNLLTIGTSEVWDAVSKLGISREEFKDSCTILCDRLVLVRSKEISREPSSYSISEKGLERYLEGREPEFWKQFNEASYAVLNEGIADNDALAARLGVDRLRARLILIMMERRQDLRLRHSFGGHVTIKEVRPNLRRRLQGA
jgi:hypothetical protein